MAHSLELGDDRTRKVPRQIDRGPLLNAACFSSNQAPHIHRWWQYAAAAATMAHDYAGTLTGYRPSYARAPSYPETP